MGETVWNLPNSHRKIVKKNRYAGSFILFSSAFRSISCVDDPVFAWRREFFFCFCRKPYGWHGCQLCINKQTSRCNAYKSIQCHHKSVYYIEKTIRKLEEKALVDLKNAITDSETLKDYVSRDLFRSMLDSEEEHVDVIETHLNLVEKVGKENWLQSQI